MGKPLRPTPYDYIIVGQGLAGTLLDYFLTKSGARILVIDHHHNHAASKVAAGVINPITGRNFVLSWRFQDFYHVALQTYDELSSLLGDSYWINQSIIRTLGNIEEETQWISKSADDVIGQYIQYPTHIGAWSSWTKWNGNHAQIIKSGRVELNKLITAYKQHLIDQSKYLDDYYDESKLDTSDNVCLSYGDIKAYNIVYCQGAQATNTSPYFGDIKLSATKGQVLIIRCVGLNVNEIYKRKFFVIPLGGDLYWVGAGYEWNATDDLPTDIGKQEIIDHLSDMIDMPPYEIVDHLAGLRPTVHTRRPILRTSHIDDRIHLLNGLGTKGASIAPFVTRQFARYLLHRDPNDLIL
jgi:glycine/D-amino acid oxidase-like deaminating enzyme